MPLFRNRYATTKRRCDIPLPLCARAAFSPARSGTYRSRLHAEERLLMPRACSRMPCSRLRLPCSPPCCTQTPRQICARRAIPRESPASDAGYATMRIVMRMLCHESPYVHVMPRLIRRRHANAAKMRGRACASA